MNDRERYLTTLAYPVWLDSMMQGRLADEIAAQILRGENPSDIPFVGLGMKERIQ